MINELTQCNQAVLAGSVAIRALGWLELNLEWFLRASLLTLSKASALVS